MNNCLYPCFNHWFSKNGQIYFYSDPHFDELDMIKKRNITDEEQIKRINSKVGKNDTIIFLGDIGNVDCIKKIRGYKVLLLGNHDSGSSNYLRRYLVKDKGDQTIKDDLSNREHREVVESWFKERKDDYIFEDNHLFDEIYSGMLTISDKIVLSHIAINIPGMLNIHGHDHEGSDFTSHVLKYFDADMNPSEMIDNYLTTIKKDNLTNLNICAEFTNYYPISLTKIIKSGILHSLVSVNRNAINNATKKSLKRKNKSNKKIRSN